MVRDGMNDSTGEPCMIRADSTLAAAGYRLDCPQSMLTKLKRPQNDAPKTAAIGAVTPVFPPVEARVRSEGRTGREAIEVHGRADHCGAARAGGGAFDRRGLPQAWDQHGDVLRLEG
jgi:hypothetical protein